MIFSEQKTRNDFFSSIVARKCIISCDDIILHVEWLAIDGEQKYSQMKSLLFNKSILNIEQQLYLSFIQSKNFNEDI